MKYIITIAAVILLISCNNKVVKPEAEDNDTVLATWRGGKIYAHEFKSLASKYKIIPDSIKIFENPLKNAVAGIINAQLVIQMSESLKIDTVSTVKKKYLSKLNFLAAEELRRDSIIYKVIPKSEFEKLYEKKKYSYKIKHILIKDNKISFIDSIYNILLKDPRKFNLLAEQNSDDKPTAGIGGDLGWFSYEDMPDEFKIITGPEQVNKISAPVKTKFGKHIIVVEDTIRNNNIRSFEDELFSMVGEIETKNDKETDERRYKYTEKLFEKYYLEIDTLMADCTVLLYNYYKDKGLDLIESFKPVEDEIVFASYGNYNYTLKILLAYIRDYFPGLIHLDRKTVIKGVHSMYRRPLLIRAANDLNYINKPETITAAKIMSVKDFELYLIYNYFLPDIVKDFENGIIKTFPSLSEIYSMWYKSLFEKYQVQINNQIQDLIK